MYRIEILKYKKILIIIEKVMSKNTKKQFVIKEQFFFQKIFKILSLRFYDKKRYR